VEGRRVTPLLGGRRARAAGLGAGVQPAPLLEARDLGLAQVPELAATDGGDLLRLRELAQPLMADGEFFGGDGQEGLIAQMRRMPDPNVPDRDA